MRAIFIALKDLRLRLRDRSAIVLAFIAPLILAFIISSALGQEEGVFRATFAVVDDDKSDISKSFVEGIRSVPALKNLELKEVKDRDEAVALMDKEESSAAFVIPSGFGQSITTGQPAKLTVLRSPAFPVGGQVAKALADAFAAEINAGGLTIQTAVDSGLVARPGAPDLNTLIQKAVGGRIPVNLVDGKIGVNEVSSADYFAPGMTIFFLFFTVQFGALGILAERRDGTLPRLLAAPIKPSTVIIGKELSSFVLGLGSMLTMMVVTSILLDANWGDPLAAVALAVAITLAAMGVTGLAISLARTQEQAAGFGSITAMGLALLGGNFLQITDAPWIIRTLSLLTPNGWALRSFFDLAAEGGGISSILPGLGAVFAFAVVTGALALLLGRRLVVT